MASNLERLVFTELHGISSLISHKSYLYSRFLYATLQYTSTLHILPMHSLHTFFLHNLPIYSTGTPFIYSKHTHPSYSSNLQLFTPFQHTRKTCMFRTPYKYTKPIPSIHPFELSQTLQIHQT